MTSPILITGGTGTLGRLVVARLRSIGRDLRVLSRRCHELSDGIEPVLGDLITNDGIEAAVEGAEIIVHLAGGPKGDDVATRNLVQAAARRGVKHLVLISVVGADRMPLRYFRSKLAAEQAMAESGVPWSTLRSAQFHDFVLMATQKMATLPVLLVPAAVRLQPVDAGEVAARLVEIALGPPVGLVPDVVGPTVYPMADLIRGYLRACGRHRMIVPVRLPGKVGRAYRAGANLSVDEAMGRRTWEEFLADRSDRLTGSGAVTPTPRRSATGNAVGLDGREASRSDA